MDQQAVKCCSLSGLDFPDDFRKCAPILQNTQQQYFFFLMRITYYLLACSLDEL